MTWTLSVDDKTIRITDSEKVQVEKLLDKVGSAGYHFEYTADDGTEIKATEGSSVTLTHDG